MKRIAIDIRLVGKGRTGDEVVCTHLVRAVIARDAENEYFLLTDEHRPQRLAAVAMALSTIGRANVRIVSLWARNRFLWNALALPLWLLCRRPDTFHTQYILPLFVPRTTRVVLHIHDVSFAAHPEYIGALDRFFLKLFIPHALVRADAVVVPSRFTKSEIIRYFGTPEHKIIVVPNAVDRSFAQGVTDDTIRHIRKRYHLPEKYFIAVGTLQPRKNIPFLLEAFAEVRKRLPEWGLVLVGNRAGHHTDPDIAAVIKRLGLTQAVFFPGYVRGADLPHIIAAAGVYVFPSRYEGFGIPLLEALRAGVPIACTDSPVFHEVAGDLAHYFQLHNVATAAETLYAIAIAHFDLDEYRKRARARADMFSWEESARLLHDLYLH